MSPQNRQTRRGFLIQLSISKDSDLIAWLDQQDSYQATIKAALYAMMNNQPLQADPIVDRLTETLARAEKLLTTIQRAPVQVSPINGSVEAVDTDFVQAVRGNMRPAFKPKRS